MGITLDELENHLEGRGDLIFDEQLDLSETGLNEDALNKFLISHEKPLYKLICTKINLSKNLFTTLDYLIPFLDKVVDISKITKIDLTCNSISQEAAEKFLSALFFSSINISAINIHLILLPDIHFENKHKFLEHVNNVMHNSSCKIQLVLKNRKDTIFNNENKKIDLILEPSFFIDEISNEKDLSEKAYLLRNKPTLFSKRSLFFRFMIREKVLWSIIEKLLLLNNPEYQKIKKRKPLIYRLFSSNAVPLLNRQIENDIENSKELEERDNNIFESLEHQHGVLEANFEFQKEFIEKLEQQRITRFAVLKLLYRIYNIKNATTHFFQEILPFATVALLLQDAIQYCLLPERRYGMPWYALLTGLYRRGFSILGGTFDGFPNQLEFGAVPVSFILTFLLTILLEAILQARYLNQPEKISQILNAIYTKIQINPSFIGIQHLLPYSRYRQALKAASFLLAWDRYGGGLRMHSNRLVNLVANLAEHAPLLLAWPAFSALACAADSYNYPLSAPTYARQRLNELSQQPIGFRRQLANYYRFTLGEEVTPWQQLVYILISISRFGFSSYALYRIGLILYSRILQAYEFFSAATACAEQHRIWAYSEVTGEYDCVICDYPLVAPHALNNPQACLNRLFVSMDSWPQLLEGLNSLRYFSGYTQLDISTLNFPSWNETMVRQFLSRVNLLAAQWRIINFSVPTINPIWPSDGRLILLANFLNQHSPQVLDISRLNIGDMEWNNFLNQLQSNQLMELISQQNGLSDQSFIQFAAWYSNHSAIIDRMDFSGNFMTDNGLQNFLSVLPLNQSYDLAIANNQLTGQSLQWLATQFRYLNLEGNDLTGGDFLTFGNALGRMRNLFELNLRNTQLDDPSLVILGRTWQNQNLTLQTLLAGNNALTGQGIRVFAQDTIDNSIHRVDWSNNPIDDNGFSQLLSILPNLNWDDIDFSSLPITPQALSNMWLNLPRALRVIRVNGFNFGDEAFEPSLIFLNQHNRTLEIFAANNNQISNNFAGRLFDAACRAGIPSISLENNQLSSFFNFLNNDIDTTHYRCTDIYLAGNDFTDSNIMALYNSLKRLPFQWLDVSGAPLTDFSAFQLAVRLIELPNPDDLNNDVYSYDKAREVNKEAKAETEITYINLKDTAITAKGNRALQRVAGHLPDTVIQTSNDNAKTESYRNIRQSFWWNKSQPINKRSIKPTAEQLWSPEKITPPRHRALGEDTASFSSTLILGIVSLANGVLLLLAIYCIYRMIRSWLDRSENENNEAQRSEARPR